MQNSFSTQGIVLRIQPFREADIIVTLLTPANGRISAIARSARNSKRRFVGGIDIFDCGTAELSKPKINSSLFACNSFHREVFWFTLRKSLLKLSLASLATELTLHLSMDDDDHSKELYLPFLDFFEELDNTKNTNAAFSCLIKIVLQELTITGYSPLACQHLFPSDIIPWWETLLTTELISPPPSRAAIYHSTTRLIQFVEKITERQLSSRESVIGSAKTLLLANTKGP